MEEKVNILSRVPILAEISAENLRQLAARAQFVTHPKGELVVREGEAGEAFYVVVSGRLQAFTRMTGGGERVLTMYTTGDFFGEVPLVSNERHWASVRVLNDAVLLHVPREDFEAVVRGEPLLALKFSARLGQRITLLRQESRRAQGATIIALKSAIPIAGKTLLANNLAVSLARETGASVLVVDLSCKKMCLPLVKCEGLYYESGKMFDDLIARRGHGHDELGLLLTGDEKEAQLIAPLLSFLAKRYAYVLLDLPNEESPASFECLVQADQIYVITKKDEEHLYKTRLLLQDLRSHRIGSTLKTRVIVTAADAAGALRVEEIEKRIDHPVDYTLAWIPHEKFAESVDGTPFMLRDPTAAYSRTVRRMARELGGALVGLALGTGSARGFAHIGVIRVLEREGISVDVVAGSSMGALIGAGWATGKTADEMEEIAKRVKGKRAFLRLLDPMWPGSGFIRGIKVSDFLHEIFDDLTFADALIPLKITATNLDTLESVILEEGKLVDAVRASISIPGVFRPVRLNGAALIDGGVSDPVPVNVLARAGVSKIIAVNTIPTVEHLRQRTRIRQEAEKISEKHRGMLQEIGAAIETPTTIIDIYMRAMLAMQSQISEANCANADVVLRPIVPDAVWYDFYNPEKYIRVGEQAAEMALPQLKELVRA
jgi:predicted acylesterase/phospholipase RssA/CRP-like cAMP-binding protein